MTNEIPINRFFGVNKFLEERIHKVLIGLDLTARHFIRNIDLRYSLPNSSEILHQLIKQQNMEQNIMF